MKKTATLSVPLTDPADESSASPIRQRRKEERPGELLAAALAQFVERGYSATRLDDVAAQAGVTKGTLYLYYDNKEALFKAVLAQNLVPLIDEGRRYIEQHQGSQAELLKGLMMTWWQQVGATATGGIFKLIISESGNFPDAAAYYYEAVILPAREMIGGVLRRGIEQGEFRPMDVESAFHVIFAPLLMLSLWRHSFAICGQGIDPQKYLATSVEMTLNGLRQEGIAVHSSHPNPSL
ncbi:TetR/AcrR family transcriptional regulator [Denitratisoma sp. agr-D3]